MSNLGNDNTVNGTALQAENPDCEQARRLAAVAPELVIQLEAALKWLRKNGINSDELNLEDMQFVISRAKGDV